MNREEYSANKIKEFFGDIEFKIHATDPEYSEIMHKFLYGDIYSHGKLSDRERGLITLVVLTANQTLDLLKDYTKVALKSKATPVEIKEALFQCAPYVGMTRVVLALRKVNEAFADNGIELLIERQGTTYEETRFAEGYKKREVIFGAEATKNGVYNAPEEVRHIQDYLCGYCFGDFYTRNGLDLKMRELLTFCMLASLGGCEAQLKAHIKGNLNVGNTKETLLDAITQSLPHIGFPRTLNAIACVREICV